MWIIIPAFNEATVIGSVVAEVRSVFPHIICVDDGSADHTAQIAQHAGAYVVRHPVNLGQGAALQTGVEFARSHIDAQIFVTFDADGQHQISDVQRMITRLINEDVDIVMGTRFATSQSAHKVPWVKRLILRTAARLSPQIHQLGLSDAHNGLRVFNRRVADELDLTMNGMSHAGEFIALIIENHWRVTEEPIEILYTDYSKAKGQPLLNGINIAVDRVLRKRISR